MSANFGSSGGVEAGKAYVTIGGNIGPLLASLKLVQSKLTSMGTTLKSMGAGFAKIGAVITAPLALAVKTGIAFEDQMAVVKSVLLGIPDDVFSKLVEQAKELGRTTSFTASQVAQGMENLSRAGFNAAEVMEAIPAMLDLARAGALDLASAADIAANTVRQFKLEASDLARVADVLAITSARSNTTVTALGEALKFVGLSSQQAGQSIEETAAALGVMANAGLRGSMAGTSLDNVFRKLVDKSKKATEIFRKYRVELTQLNGEFRPITQILADLGVAINDLPGPEKIAIFQELFGIRGKKAAGAIAGLVDQLPKLKAEIDNASGAAGKMAKIMLDTLGGSLTKMMSALEGVKIAIFEALVKPIRSVVDTMTKWFGVATTFIQVNHTLAMSIAKIGVAFLAVGAALFAVGAFFAGVGFAVSGVLAVLSTFMAVWGGLVGIIGLIFSPLGTALLLIIRFWDTFTQVMGLASGAMKPIIEAIRDATGEFSGFVQEVLRGGFKIKTHLLGVWLSILKEWTSVTNSMITGWEFVKTTFLNAGQVILRGMITVANKISEVYYGLARSIANQFNELVKAHNILVSAISPKLAVSYSDVETNATKAAKFYSDAYKNSADKSAKSWKGFEDDRLMRAQETGQKITALQEKVNETYANDTSSLAKKEKKKSSGVIDSLKKQFGDLSKKFKGAGFKTPQLPSTQTGTAGGGVEVFTGGAIGEQLGILSTDTETVDLQKKSNEWLEGIFENTENLSLGGGGNQFT